MYKALKSFGGVVSMKKGEVKAITNNTVVADLLAAGYIEEVGKTEPKKAAPADEKTETKAPQKRKKKQEG